MTVSGYVRQLEALLPRGRLFAALGPNFRGLLDAYPRGGVVLMHDTRPWSVHAFPLILAEIDRRNARLVARGEAPYRIIGLEEFWQPLRNDEAPRGMPLPRRRRTRSR